MKKFPIQVSTDPMKDDEQIITLVESHDIEDGVLDRSSPPYVHFLDANNVPKFEYGNTLTSGRAEEPSVSDLSPKCLICSAKLGVSGRGSVNIFSKEIKTTTRNLDLDIALSSIINCNLQPSEMPSTTMCKKCFRSVDDIDELEDRLFNMKQDVINKYMRTQPREETNSIFLLSEDNYDPEGIASISKDDMDFRMYPAKKVRPKRRKRGRGRPPSYVELEVKEEVNEDSVPSFEVTPSTDIIQSSLAANDSLSSRDLVVQFYDENGIALSIDEENDYVVVDGYDIGREESFFQVAGTSANRSSSVQMSESLSIVSQPKFKCRYCMAKFDNFSCTEKHLIEFHHEQLFDCEVCGKQLSAQHDLLEHLEEHLSSGEKPYGCNYCVQQFAIPQQLRQHVLNHRGKTCYQCSKRFLSEAEFQTHMNAHSSAKPFSCEKCQKRFASKPVLKAHMKTHGVRPRPHSCKVCQKSFLNSNHLQDHMQIHRKRKDFVCISCNKAFSTQRSLDLHALTHSGIKNYACRICHKAFARKGEVEDHERIHTNERPFCCEHCGATFKQRSNLLTHKKATHYGEKRYQCSECTKAFKRRRLLVYHMMSVHTGERPFKCHICSAAFVYPEHYKKHLRIHTGEKPFKCEICGKTFNSRDNKNAHKFIHSDKKQYECIICGSGFMRRPLLSSHLVQHQQNGAIPDNANLGAYVKVNPPSVVDTELLSENNMLPSSTVNVKMDDDTEIIHTQIEGTDLEIMSRPIQLMETDDLPKYIPKYIIHTGGKGEENVGNFLASLQAQIVEVRTEDLEQYELSPGHLTQMAHVAAQVVANHSTTQSSDRVQPDSFHIELEDKRKGSLSPSTITVSANPTILHLESRESPSTHGNTPNSIC